MIRSEVPGNEAKHCSSHSYPVACNLSLTVSLVPRQSLNLWLQIVSRSVMWMLVLLTARQRLFIRFFNSRWSIIFYPYQLHHQEVDLVMAPLSITGEREAVVDFSYPFWWDSLGMMTMTIEHDVFYLVKPLHIYVWMCYVIILLVAAQLVSFSESWAVSLGINRDTSPFCHLKESVWYLFGTMWNQGI